VPEGAPPDMKPTLVLLAAGIGSRFGGLKQIEPVGLNGESIIDFSIFDALRTGFEKVVFVIRKEIEDDFREHVLSRMGDRIDFRLAYQSLEDIPAGFTVPEERKKPWGTAHAVLSAESRVDTNFAVLNCDDFYGRESFKILSAFLSSLRPESPQGALVGFPLVKTLSDHGTVSRAECVTDEKDSLTDIRELTKVQKQGNITTAREPGREDEIELSPDTTVSMNMFGFTPEIFRLIQKEFTMFLKEKGDQPTSEFYIPSALDVLIKNNEMSMRVLHTRSAWFGMTYKEDLPMVKKSIRDLIESGVYPEKLWD
jgi:NDP-sugar pyrophosphorylase family protein